MTRWLVVGGGMRGIMAASVLARDGHDVTLLESAAMLGGVLCSQEWGGLYVDKGCHMLDFSHVPSGQLFQDILGDRMRFVEVRYASINRGIKTDGIAVPDMSRFLEHERRVALDEIKAAVEGVNGDATTLTDTLVHRFGLTAGDYAAQCVRKMSGYQAHDLAPEAFETLSLVHRMRLGADAEMELLKKRRPEFDARLAMSSQGDPWRFYPEAARFGHRNAYPTRKGMRGFCEAAAEYLQRIGVTLVLGASLASLNFCSGAVEAVTSGGDAVRAERCYWATPSTLFLCAIGRHDPLAGKSRPVSMVLFTYKVEPSAIGDYTYLHDYSTGTLMFRGSAAGIYGGQRDSEGLTYVSVEVPVSSDHSVWQQPDNFAAQVWAEAQTAGLVAQGAQYAAVKTDPLRTAYMLAGPGWSAAKSAHDELLEPYREIVVFGGAGTFGKAAIMESVRQELAEFSG